MAPEEFILSEKQIKRNLRDLHNYLDEIAKLAEEQEKKIESLTTQLSRSKKREEFVSALLSARTPPELNKVIADLKIKLFVTKTSLEKSEQKNEELERLIAISRAVKEREISESKDALSYELLQKEQLINEKNQEIARLKRELSKLKRKKHHTSENVGRPGKSIKKSRRPR